MSGPKTISIHDVSETVATVSRTLQNGTKLEYRMQVLQQPERARACGQGAKSHADRRPVDPPPVVELRLFEGHEKTDVTFSHNSNFFLFATLEQARPIAQGRGMPAPAPAPVLTGVPVSGMAYLDRPNPAGYFIFPDLSVRHEGKYRLRFALYEETKEEEGYPAPQDPLEPREYCTHRLDVKSRAFTVFSAKKFPGLAENTALSRIVAEQGCRVRIRRDVRMRRRSDRPSRDSEDRHMDETAMLRASRRAATPDQYEIENSIRAQHTPQYHQSTPHPMQRSNSINRKRSGSDASMISAMGDMPQAPRHENGYSTPNQNYPPYGPPAGPPSQSAHQHLSFGSNGHAPAPPAPPAPHVHPPQELYGQDMQSRYPPPPSHAQNNVHHPSPHMPSSTRTQQHPYGAPQYHSRENSISLPNQQVQQQPRHEPHHVRRDSGEFRARRDSDPAYRQQPPQHYRPGTPVASPYGQMENGYGHQQQQQHQPYQPGPPAPQQYHHQQPQQQPQQHAPPPPQSTGNSLPPIRLPALGLPALEPKIWNSQPTTPNSTNPPAALPSPGAYPPHTNAPMPSQRPPPPQMSQPPPPPNPNQFPAYYPEPKYTTPPAPSNDSWGSSNGSAPAKESEGRGTKRPWGRVFNNAHVEGPMQNRSRPSSNSAAYGSDPPPYAQQPEVDDDAYDFGKLKMSYRRADGVEIVHRLPGED
ncbi:unnamed protein product [Tuber melanosporum]|uniref:(Perigord truffle) hypothetical protein n=1 Tax=Tuber melanosporum (strain Mel28) TaxID=656061 RepID=D5GGG5_TUBMM|nr:uncharacterized protein GSTUM_00007375001 [Tuber melanosporum]CAZ83608.1 unnamed protein product [Tuber melanosporum]